MRSGLLRLAVCAALWCPVAGCAALEESLIFHPRRFPLGNWHPADLVFQDASFQAADGTHLHGWFATPVEPRAVVLYCHGNAGNVTCCAWVVEFFYERLNCAILVFDYRGYGRSEGHPTEAGILMDARAARAWLAQRAGVAEGDIVLVGHSLGGGVAVDLAAKDGARALVLQSTFTSVPDAAEHVVAPLPVRWLMSMNLDSQSLIGKYRGPLLQTHGDADTLIPFEEGRKLFEAAKGPKFFVAAPGRGHNDLPTPEFVECLDRFLARLPEWDAETKKPHATTR